MADFYERLAARLKGRPEKTQEMSINTSAISNVLGGIGLDPKASKAPDESIPAFMGRRIREAATDTYAPISNAVTSAINTAAPATKEFVGGLTNTVPVVSPVRTAPTTVNNAFTPSPAEETARRARMPVNTIAAPQGVANIQRGTGVVEAPITNPQEAERVRLAGIASRISPENPYGADVTNSALRTGQVRVGAATDAEAAKNLADSTLQNQATANRVTEINRATGALKDLRAARLGISRSELDSGNSAPPLVVGEAGGGFGSDVLDRDRYLRQFEAPPGSFGKTQRLAQANGIEARRLWNQEQQAKEKPTALSPIVNPLDMGRFLLDQQKFGWQQGIDKGRLATDMAKVEDSASGTALEKQKYADERRKSFMETFSYPDKDAPQGQLGVLTLSLSDFTGGQIPPELMVGYLQKAAEENKVDWKDAPPKSLTALGKRAMELAAADYR